jgi:flagellum-specific peptidoglycan hydrolase FlgJ
LGYVLPIYGADGIYGKETQSAINNFISKNKLSPSINKAMPEILAKIASQLQNKNTSNPQITKQQPTTKSNNIFTDINLATNEGYTQYANVCDKFISTKVNSLNITGEMMAYAAQNAFNKYQSYIPPELALGQLIIEGGIGNKNLNSKPIRTKNPFNIGNWDAGKTTIHKTVQDSINAYYNAIGRDYLSGKKSAISLLTNFTNYADNRYASDPNYENKLFSIVKNVNKIINSTT